MNRLAIDTAGAACQVTVQRSGHEPVSASEEMMRGHAEAVFPMIASVMDAAGVVSDALDQIVVTTGPGSFTGVRIGLAAVAGLVAGRDIRVFGLTSFDALRHTVKAACRRSEDRPLLIAINSRRSDLFISVFGSGEDPGSGPRQQSVSDVEAMMPAGCLLAGDGAGQLCGGAGTRDSGVRLPSLEAVLDAVDVTSGAIGSLPDPLYIRPPDVSYPVS